MDTEHEASERTPVPPSPSQLSPIQEQEDCLNWSPSPDPIPFIFSPSPTPTISPEHRRSDSLDIREVSQLNNQNLSSTLELGDISSLSDGAGSDHTPLSPLAGQNQSH